MILASLSTCFSSRLAANEVQLPKTWSSVDRLSCAGNEMSFQGKERNRLFFSSFGPQKTPRIFKKSLLTATFISAFQTADRVKDIQEVSSGNCEISVLTSLMTKKDDWIGGMEYQVKLLLV